MPSTTIVEKEIIKVAKAVIRRAYSKEAELPTGWEAVDSGLRVRPLGWTSTGVGYWTHKWWLTGPGFNVRGERPTQSWNVYCWEAVEGAAAFRLQMVKAIDTHPAIFSKAALPVVETWRGQPAPVEFPPLVGTPRQVSWAEAIRKKAADRYGDPREFHQHYAGYLESKFWIENRAQFGVA
jgi:hypothetical protein